MALAIRFTANYFAIFNPVRSKLFCNITSPTAPSPFSFHKLSSLSHDLETGGLTKENLFKTIPCFSFVISSSFVLKYL